MEIALQVLMGERRGRLVVGRKWRSEIPVALYLPSVKLIFSCVFGAT